MREGIEEGAFFRRIAGEHTKARTYHRNRERLWRQTHQKEMRASNRASYHRHAEQRRVEARARRKLNMLDPAWRAKEKVYRTARTRHRMATDLNYVIRQKLRTRIGMALFRHGTEKSRSTVALLGCSIDELKRHIESLWKPGMTWENWKRHGWHVDHIRPCASFDLTDLDQQRQCFHYTNLQPLWAFDNLSKGPRLVSTSSI